MCHFHSTVFSCFGKFDFTENDVTIIFLIVLYGRGTWFSHNGGRLCRLRVFESTVMSEDICT